MKTIIIVIAFLVFVTFSQAALAADDNSISGFLTGIIGAVQDFISKFFNKQPLPDLVVNSISFSGGNLEITVLNSGKAAAELSPNDVSFSLPKTVGQPWGDYELCLNLQGQCKDNPNIAISCSGTGLSCKPSAAGCICAPAQSAAMKAVTIAAGSSYKFSYPVAFPKSFDFKSMKVSVEIDPSKKISESSRTNNQYSGTVKVTTP